MIAGSAKVRVAHNRSEARMSKGRYSDPARRSCRILSRTCSPGLFCCGLIALSPRNLRPEAPMKIVC